MDMYRLVMYMANKINIQLTLDKVLVLMIDELVNKIGKGATRSGWINDSLHTQLKNELGLQYIGKKRKFSKQDELDSNN